VTQHRFATGQAVRYTQTRFPNLMSGKEGTILRPLPTRYFGPEYLVDFPGHPSGFIAGEYELSLAAARRNHARPRR
jgi:hypothetical protein